LDVPAEFYAVGQFFRDFSQVSDEDVVETLRRSETRISAAV
jgi:predicted phosphoribosyltransferase